MVLKVSANGTSWNGNNIDITGTWTGKLLQPSGGFSSQYIYKMFLIQTGNTVTGTSTIQSQGYYGEISLSGEFTDSKLSFNDITIISSNLSGYVGA